MTYRLDHSAPKPAGWALDALVGISAVAPASLYAHHSDAAFDTDAVIAIRGTVEQFVWRNPHVYIYLSAEAGSGPAVFVCESPRPVAEGSRPCTMR